jgi:hypothetical protein
VLLAGMLLTLVIGLLFVLSQSNLMTFPLLQNTVSKIAQVSQLLEGDVSYDIFLSGGHARIAAINYYLNQPVKWIGDGPGTVYDTASGERSVGAWGHVFTFYAEVGLIGWFLSILIFYIIAFPIRFDRSTVRIRVGWVGVMMFLAVNIVTIVKYPMGNAALIFTYCIILIGHRALSISWLDKSMPGYGMSLKAAGQD